MKRTYKFFTERVTIEDEEGLIIVEVAVIVEVLIPNEVLNRKDFIEGMAPKDYISRILDHL